MSRASREAMRAWPRSERCLARERSRRSRSRGSDAADTAAPSAYKARVASIIRLRAVRPRAHGRIGPEMRSRLARALQNERVNYVLTNRIPRRSLTRLMGWYSRIESPLLCRVSLAVWRRLAGDLDLSEARQKRFRSLHECFTRELKE